MTHIASLIFGLSLSHAAAPLLLIDAVLSKRTPWSAPNHYVGAFLGEKVVSAEARKQIAIETQARILARLDLATAEVRVGRVTRGQVKRLNIAIDRLRQLAGPGDLTAVGVATEAFHQLRADVEAGRDARRGWIADLASVATRAARGAQRGGDVVVRATSDLVANLRSHGCPPDPRRVDERERDAAEAAFVDAIRAERLTALDDLVDALVRREGRVPGARRRRVPWFDRDRAAARDTRDLLSSLTRALARPATGRRYFDARFQELTRAIWNSAGGSPCETMLYALKPN